MQRTPHFLLRLFESADKPTWLEDWNDTMLQLDAALFNLAGGGDTPSIEEIVSRLDALTQSVYRIEDDVTDIQSTITQIQSILTNLSTTVSTHTSEIADLSSSLAGLSSQLSSLDDRVTALEQGGGGGQYVLPIASANTLGGVKVGNNLSIDENGVLSANRSGLSFLKYFPDTFNTASGTSVALTQEECNAMAYKPVLLTFEFTADMDEYTTKENHSVLIYCFGTVGPNNKPYINQGFFTYSERRTGGDLSDVRSACWEIVLGSNPEDYTPISPHISIIGESGAPNTDFSNLRVYVLDEISGGSGGATSYNDLTDLPSVNNNTLQGNKSTSQLGITDGLTGTYSGETLTLSR